MGLYIVKWHFYLCLISCIVRVQEGDEVKAGQLLLTFSLSEIEKVDGVKTTSAIVVNNSDELPVFEVLRTGQGKAGSRLFKVK